MNGPLFAVEYFIPLHAPWFITLTVLDKAEPKPDMKKILMRNSFLALLAAARCVLSLPEPFPEQTATPTKIADGWSPKPTGDLWKGLVSPREAGSVLRRAAGDSICGYITGNTGKSSLNHHCHQNHYHRHYNYC